MLTLGYVASYKHSLPEMKCSAQSLECSVGVQWSLLMAATHLCLLSLFLGILINVSPVFLPLALSQPTAQQIDGILTAYFRYLTVLKMALLRWCDVTWNPWIVYPIVSGFPSDVLRLLCLSSVIHRSSWKQHVGCLQTESLPNDSLQLYLPVCLPVKNHYLIIPLTVTKHYLIIHYLTICVWSALKAAVSYWSPSCNLCCLLCTETSL